MEFLPIDPHLPEIVSVLKREHTLVLSAPPGAGKTTRVPRALYDAGFADEGEIAILEPRRLAARLSAARVAAELGEKPGETAGYSIRFENVAGPSTRIRFLTEAILARQLVSDPNIEKTAVVILDEFHERHLANDLALALLKRLHHARPGLKIIVMSATLDVAPICSFLDAPSLLIAGSPHEISIEYEERASDRALHEKVVYAVARLCAERCPGDILVFLPGSFEIRRSMEALEPLAQRHGFIALPLHGDLPSQEQRSAIEPAERKKVILSTNVAETSLTIPGIAAVIDSGFARSAGHSPWSGFATLSTVKISKSSAIQRAGRAGRTQAGKVLRLYTRADYDSRPEFDVPEIRRVDMTETALLLRGSGIPDLQAFPWFESPPKAALEAADTLLAKLQAIDSEGQITPIGKRMLQLPVHPRLARLIIEGVLQQAGEESILLAALLSERDIRAATRTAFGAKRHSRPGAASQSDLLELLDAYHNAEAARFDSRQVAALGLDMGTVQAVRRSRDQLQRIARQRLSFRQSSSGSEEEGILISTLAAFPDRVFKRRKPNSRELLMAGGGVAILSPASVVHGPMFGVAVDAEERRSHGGKETGAVVRLASSIETDWLAGLFPSEISESIDLVWNEQGGRVDQYHRTSYGQIALEEKTIPAPPSERAAQLLEGAVTARRLSDFHDFDSVPLFAARASLLTQSYPEEKFFAPDEKAILEAVHEICIGKTRLQELAGVSIIASLTSRMSDRQRVLLNRETPERVRLNTGRAVKIHYEPAKPPWIESRLQDFFGMTETPSICSGRVPLTIHLLAPNGRAVQVTSDLAGFWKNHYPPIRRELQRRYPRHSWLESPAGN